MSFSADAIGFYMQLDDQLTPGLKRAARSYEQFTKGLDKQNQRAVRSVNKGFAAMASLVKSFDSMPKRALASYQRTYQALRRAAKPLQQTIELTLSNKKVQNGLATAIAGAVRKALERMKLTLRPTLPKTRARGFDTRESLRTAYRHMVQPPDLVGTAKVPKFNKGGMVTQGSGRQGIDDVVAMLSKGEMIIPKREAARLKQLAGMSRISGKFVQGITDMQNMALAMEKLITKGNLTGRLSRVEKKLLAAGIAGTTGTSKQTWQAFARIGTDKQNFLVKDITAASKKLREASKSGGELLRSMSLTAKVTKALKSGFDGVKGVLGQIAGSTKFLSMMRAFNTLRRGVKEGLHGVAQVMGAKGDIQGPIEGLNTLNRGLHISRDELARLGVMANKMSQDMGDTVLNPTIMTEALNALYRAGARTNEEFAKLAPTVALATQAMHISEDTASGLARRLGSTFKMTRDEVADVFADMGRVASKAGIDAEDLAQSIMDDTERMGMFVVNLSGADRKAVLGNMTALQGSLVKNFGDTGNKIGAMLSDALGDATSESAMNVMNLTGLTGGSSGSLAAALKSGDISKVISGISSRAQMAQGNSTVAAQLAQALGFQGNGLEFANFAKNAGSMVDDLTDLRKGALGAGEGFKALKSYAEGAASAIEQGQNKIANAAAPGSVTAQRALMEADPTRLSDAMAGIGSVWHLIGGIGLGGLIGKVGGKAAGGIGALAKTLFGGGARAAGGAAAGVVGRGAASGVAGAIGGAALRALGPLTMMNDAGMGEAEENRLVAPGAQGGRAAANSYAALQAAAMRAAYADQHPFLNFVSGTDYSAPGLTDSANRILSARGITPRNAQFLKAAGANGPLSPDQILAATTASAAAAASRAAVSQDAQVATLLQAILDKLPMVGGVLAAPANGGVAPARQRPVDTVTRGLAQGEH